MCVCVCVCYVVLVSMERGCFIPSLPLYKLMCVLLYLPCKQLVCPGTLEVVCVCVCVCEEMKIYLDSDYMARGSHM